MKRSERARELFLMGYNCSQAVLGAFHDIMGMELETALKLASSFGGGVARMRHICGTVSAIFMVAGLVKGYAVNSVEAKREHYALIQSMASAFAEQQGSIICKELLEKRALKHENVDNSASFIANERTESYYNSRPCLALVEEATAFACDFLGIDTEIHVV